MASGSARTRGLVAALGSAIAAGVLAVAVVAPPQFVASWIVDDRPSSVSNQVVPPIHGTPAARIAVAGDTGTGRVEEHRTARRMLQESGTEPYDAVLLLGDLVYEDGDAALVDRVVLQPFGPLLERGAELLPVLGNHDYGSGEQDEILAALGRRAPWYSAWVGPVQVLVLDSNRVEEAEQTDWLRRTLSEPAPPGTWRIAAMHHPAYSAGHHGSDMEVRRTWAPLFEQHDVSLVLAGHDHDYQRSTVQNGVTYVVSGAGAKLRPAGRREFTAVSTSTLHYVDLLVYADWLTGRAIDHSGRLVDVFSIPRPGHVTASPGQAAVGR